MKDLATVMILQRRLNSIQRDLGPLEDKVRFAVTSQCAQDCAARKCRA